MSLRLPISETRQIILRLCQSRYLPVSMLAELMGRKQGKLRDRFITPMLREGVLELRYPDKPNRPDQGYRTTVNGAKEIASAP
jgi:ATP-dependent DNA helicase RecG